MHTPTELQSSGDGVFISTRNDFWHAAFVAHGRFLVHRQVAVFVLSVLLECPGLFGEKLVWAVWAWQRNARKQLPFGKRWVSCSTAMGLLWHLCRIRLYHMGRLCVYIRKISSLPSAWEKERLPRGSLSWSEMRIEGTLMQSFLFLRSQQYCWSFWWGWFSW